MGGELTVSEALLGGVKAGGGAGASGEAGGGGRQGWGSEGRGQGRGRGKGKAGGGAGQGRFDSNTLMGRMAWESKSMRQAGCQS